MKICKGSDELPCFVIASRSLIVRLSLLSGIKPRGNLCADGEPRSQLPFLAVLIAYCRAFGAFLFRGFQKKRMLEGLGILKFEFRAAVCCLLSAVFCCLLPTR